MSQPTGPAGPEQDPPTGRYRKAGDLGVLIIRILTETVRLMDAFLSGSWSGPT